MAGLGTLMIGLMAVASLARWRRVLERWRWLLWALMLAFPFPYIATTAGWMTAGLGRQPWLVYGLFRTVDGASPRVHSGNAISHSSGSRASTSCLGSCTSSSSGAKSCTVPRVRCTRRRSPHMADAWFAIVALLLAAYVVLDGFDLGAGAIHRIVARTDEERRAVISAIGPFWDGNEVFLLAAGGALFVAFSKVLAVVLSGLYLAVVLVVWALLLRGIALELRSHLRDGLWRTFWDAVLQLSSAGIALLLGVALGNVLRGFPLQSDGYFSLDLFSLDSPRRALAVVDGYTFSTGVLGLMVIAAHGARFLATRTEGALRDRCARLANGMALPIAAAWAIITWLSWVYAPAAVGSFPSRPLAQVLLAVAVVALTVSWERGRSGHARAAFLGSSLLVLALIGLAAASVYPVLLRSTRPDMPSMTVQSSASPDVSLAAGLRWWLVAAALVVGYFVNLFRVHSGRAVPYGEGGDNGVREAADE